MNSNKKSSQNKVVETETTAKQGENNHDRPKRIFEQPQKLRLKQL
jgi:hypothetical protein